MNLLDELLALPAPMRRMRLRQGDVRKALTALESEAGVAWLEQRIESPIRPEWGDLLYSLKPSSSILDRWVRLSKLYCLAAIDALHKAKHALVE